MFGFVRPAACRSSAPRSVTDGCPYPPLPCRAKNRNKIQLFSHRKQEISGNDGDSFHRLRTPSTAHGLLPPPTDSFHRPRGGPPPSRREVWGVRRSRPAALPSIGYRGFAVAPKPLRAPSRRFLYNPGCRVETLLVSKGVMGFLGGRVHSFHRPRGGPPPSRREVWGVRRSRPPALPSIAYRGFAVAPKPLRAPSRSLLYNSGCRVATLLVSMGVMGFLGDLREDRSRARPVGGSARRSIPSEREQPCCDL